MTLNPTAYKLLDKIYKEEEGIQDIRFDAYNNRRLTHLLKLCLITAASRHSLEIEELDVIKANTVLSYTEHFMPKALGEFGKSRSSNSVHRIMEVISRTKAPMSLQQIWKESHQDLESRDQLVRLLGDLQVAEKIQAIEGGLFLPVNKPIKDSKESIAVDWNLLTPNEREFI